MADQRPSYTLRSVYANALARLEVLKENGQLSAADYQTVVGTKRPEDVLTSVNAAIARNSQPYETKRQRLYAIVEPLLLRLESFGSALDVLSQSCPQIMGLNVIGLVWGSLRFILLVAREVSDTFDAVLDILNEISNRLVVFESYIELFGSSDIQLLEAPLIGIYAEFITFGLKSMNLFNRSILQTLGRSTWKSLGAEFKISLSKIDSCSKNIDRIAQVEHMHQTGQTRLAQESEIQKSEKFRQEIRMFFRRTSIGDMSLPTPSPLCFNDAPIDLLSVYFTGRVEELRGLQTMLSVARLDGPARCAIHGMPGVGKTQLALEYTKLFFENQQGATVFWMSASSLEKLNQGFSKILNLVNHSERMHPEQSARQTAARRWLEQAEPSGPIPWLLVLDNVNRGTIGFMKENLPRHGKHGQIIFTTRTEDVARTVCSAAGYQYKTLELKVLNVSDATKLFLDHVETPENHEPASLKDKVIEMVECLGCLPLAINQAASFMKQSHKTVNNLLDLFKNGQKHQVIEWENDLTDYEAKSIAATFSSQFEDLRRLHPNTNHLLKLLAFFNAENIRTDLLTEGASALRLSQVLRSQVTPQQNAVILPKRFVGPFKNLGKRLYQKHDQKHEFKPPSTEFTELESLFELISSPIRFHKALQELYNLSLIKRQVINDCETLNIHDLVRDMILEDQKMEGSQSQWFMAAVRVACWSVRKVEDPSSPRTWDQYELFILHIDSLTQWDEAFDGDNPNLQEANKGVAVYLRSRGRYTEAENLFQKVLTKSDKELGSNHPNTIDLMLSLGGVKWDLGKYAEAMELYNRALSTREQKLGREHLDTLQIVERIANIQQSKGLYDQARSLYDRVVKAREAKLGKDDLSTLLAVGNLAKVHRSQGLYGEAEILYKQAIEGRERLLDPQNLETLRIVDDLANCYRDQGRYDQAVELFDRVLKARRYQLGADHPETLWTEDNLAKTYHCQGRYVEAEVLYKRVLSCNESQLGYEHQETLWTVDGLANVFLSQERYTEARSLFERALTGREKRIGVNHPLTLRTVHGLARATHQELNYTKAEELYNRALSGRRAQFRRDHPDTLRTLHELGNVYKSQGRLEEAESLYREAIMASKIQLGPSHPDTQTMIKSLSGLLNDLGRGDEGFSIDNVPLPVPEPERG